MSDVEEPPTKMSKYTDLQYLEDDCEDIMDEGQEEWLSEEALTDDEYNPDTEIAKMESHAAATKEEDAPQIQKNETSNVQKDLVKDNDQKEANIEETLNSLDGKEKSELMEELDTFTIRKVDGTVLDSKVKDDMLADTKKEEEDDGNDTDDLLRMLGEETGKLKKKSLKVVKYEKKVEEMSTDDEFMYERSNMKALKLAKNALITRKPAAKAVPEDMSDSSDDSSDEVSTVKKMFGVARKKQATTPRATSTPRRVVRCVVPASNNDKNNATAQKNVSTTKKTTQPKSIMKLVTSKSDTKSPDTVKSVEIKTPTPLKPLDKSTSKSNNLPKSDNTPKSETIPMSGKIRKSDRLTKSVKLSDNVPISDKVPVSDKLPKSDKVPLSGKFPKFEKVPILDQLPKSDKVPLSDKFPMTEKVPMLDQLPKSGKGLKADKVPKSDGSTVRFKEPEESIDDEEFLDEEEEDEDYDEDLNEDESDYEVSKLRIRKPEVMDEEAPSDDESHTEDGSLYDELPSSDSEDMEDWFALDIRTERAGDYLPLLGAKAQELLLGERRRVRARVATLRHSLATLTESARKQAEQLRAASMALAEIDDTLRAA